ncbi:MAG: dUTP diphosphatase [candidate division WOR-3 bacterium]|nr:dUTP diphosphatase [candidate division WOR-3 bacterium]MCX7836342.1 dUTP diphosphatase [candidate division WOR-3 bacterium]MDW8113553.1 dUTP diphosphatase [candidate division WOR-3 bacterium]
MKKIKVKIKRISSIPLPKYQTPDASGLDLYSAEDKVIKKKSFATIRTGIAIEIPKGYEAQVRPRSGLAKNYGIGVLNSPGTIDADYRGEIMVILFNFSNKNFKIKKGERIAQLVFSPIVKVKWVEVKELKKSKRNEGGFGHTGR